MKPTYFSKYLTDYLTQYLPNECGVSPNTIQTYSIAFTIFLRYIKAEEGISPDRVCLKDITKPLIIHFLEWLETERKCSISTRNARLATLHSFFKYIQYRDMKGMKVWQEILSIRFKKCATPEMSYLAADAIRLLLMQPDISTSKGRRDLALLGLMYDSGARVQEIADLTPSDFRFEGTTTVRLKILVGFFQCFSFHLTICPCIYFGCSYVGVTKKVPDEIRKFGFYTGLFRAVIYYHNRGLCTSKCPKENGSTLKG